MTVHSIRPSRNRTAKTVDRANFCLIVVGLFGNRFSFSCTHLSWDVVGSFLGRFNPRKSLAITEG
jgi:hypothetical protein